MDRQIPRPRRFEEGPTPTDRRRTTTLRRRHPAGRSNRRCLTQAADAGLNWPSVRTEGAGSSPPFTSPPGFVAGLWITHAGEAGADEVKSCSSTVTPANFRSQYVPTGKMAATPAFQRSRAVPQSPHPG